METAQRVLLFWLVAMGAVAQDDAASSRPAWVVAERLNLRAEPSAHAAVIGSAERGDELTVQGCVPDCEARSAWATLAPYGAARLNALTFERPADVPPMSGYLYAKVRAGGAPVLASPKPQARRLGRRNGSDVVALRGPARDGWAHLVGGGFIEAGRLRLMEPSTRTGVLDPWGPQAFVIADVPADPENGPGAQVGQILPARSRDRRFVEVEGGRLPAGAVRIASRRPRPERVLPEEKWIHVDLNEQVLTAYEGDRWVFAALVSTGIDDWETPRGLSRVWLKSRHGLMDRTTPPDRYHVEEVPDAQYFKGNIALHGAAWHDKFGRRASHGCVNLTPWDARWLFEWAPPALPEGWHVLFVERAGQEGVWVQVEAAPRWTAEREALSAR